MYQKITSQQYTDLKILINRGRSGYTEFVGFFALEKAQNLNFNDIPVEEKETLLTYTCHKDRHIYAVFLLNHTNTHPFMPNKNG